jgi:hypothetical protein
MFINCPFCKALVATDPASDLPPEHCPRCAAKLRGMQVDASTPAPSTAAQGEPAGGPLPDPAHLMQAPPGDTPLPEGEAIAAPSELSSRIHQIVALEAPAAAPVIAPIATLLKHADDAPASPARPDGASRTASTATPATTPGPAAPAATPAALANEVSKTVAMTGTTAAADAGDPGAQAANTPAGTPRDATASTTAGSAHAAAGPVGGAGVAAAGPALQPAARPAPSFAHRHPRLRASGLHWKTLAAIAVLALLLVLQLLLADRAQLAADARWRPLLSNVCGVLGCSLPPWREPAAFTVLAREVRPHPSTPGALRVTATFRNDARWPQPWPRVRLTLSDINGNAVATRDFSADDYLGATPAQAELHSGQSASIAMDIVEPERRSVAFDFDLH